MRYIRNIVNISIFFFLPVDWPHFPLSSYTTCGSKLLMSRVIGEKLNYEKPPGTNVDTMPHNIYILQESRAGMEVAGSIA